MSVEQNITSSQNWFVGEDKVLEFEVLADDGKAVTDPTKGVEDAATWQLVWSLKKTDTAADPAIVEKRTGTGIAVVGIFNSSRATNTQRVQVTVQDTDTDTLKPLVYRHSLKRLAASGDAVLTHGAAELKKATSPPA